MTSSWLKLESWSGYAVRLDHEVYVFIFVIICLTSDDEYKGARFYFEAVKEGDQIVFGTEEELERTMWVNKLYMATGQSHKPVAPKLSMVATAKENRTNTLSRLQGGMACVHIILKK